MKSASIDRYTLFVGWMAVVAADYYSPVIGEWSEGAFVSTEKAGVIIISAIGSR